MRPKVLIAVLCGPERYQWPAPGLMMRLLEAVSTPGLEVQVVPIYGVYGYATARNRAVMASLPSDADFLCMVDNDNVPPADFVRHVVDFAQSRADADVVALSYYTRPDEGKVSTVLCTGWHGSEPNTFDLPFQLPHKWQEIEVAGTGCMFIRRAVLTALNNPWFIVPECNVRQHFIGGVGEDFAFCDSVRAAGFHIWTHGGLLCSHLHTVDLTAVANAITTRNEEDVEMLRSLGVKVPTMQTVCFAK